MSTNPPTAVMIPRVSSSGFKAVLDLLEPGGMCPQFLGPRAVGLFQNCLDFLRISGLRLAQRLGARLQLLADAIAHRFDVGRRELALARLLIDQRPFGRERARL